MTNLDHDANVTPWTLMAEEKGIAVRRCLIFIISQDDIYSDNAASNWKDRGVAKGYWKSILLIPLVQMFQLSHTHAMEVSFLSFRVNFKPGCCLLDLDHLENLLDTNTRLVALGAAANSCGSITDIAAAATIVRRLSPKALLYVDGVHYAPHRLPDVQVVLGGGFSFRLLAVISLSARLTSSVVLTQEFSGAERKFWKDWYTFILSCSYQKDKEQLYIWALLQEPFKLTACSNLLPSGASQSSRCQQILDSHEVQKLNHWFPSYLYRWETGTANFESISGIK